MIRKISFFFLISCLYLSVGAQTPQPIKQFLRKPYMEGASFSLIVKEVNSGETVFAYDTIRQLTPASVMKTVTTATALEILGEDYRFPTSANGSRTPRRKGMALSAMIFMVTGVFFVFRL